MQLREIFITFVIALKVHTLIAITATASSLSGYNWGFTGEWSIHGVPTLFACVNKCLDTYPCASFVFTPDWGLNYNCLIYTDVTQFTHLIGIGPSAKAYVITTLEDNTKLQLTEKNLVPLSMTDGSSLSGWDWRIAHQFCAIQNLKMFQAPKNEKELQILKSNRFVHIDVKTSNTSLDYTNTDGDPVDISIMSVDLPPGPVGQEYCALSRYGILSFYKCLEGETNIENPTICGLVIHN